MGTLVLSRPEQLWPTFAQLNSDIVSYVKARPDVLHFGPLGVVAFASFCLIWRLCSFMIGAVDGSADGWTDALTIALLTGLSAQALSQAVQCSMQSERLRSQLRELTSVSGKYSELRASHAEQEAENERLKKTVEAIRRQAESQGEEYMRLMQENQS